MSSGQHMLDRRGLVRVCAVQSLENRADVVLEDRSANALLASPAESRWQLGCCPARALCRGPSEPSASPASAPGAERLCLASLWWGGEGPGESAQLPLPVASPALPCSTDPMPCSAARRHRGFASGPTGSAVRSKDLTAGLGQCCPFTPCVLSRAALFIGEDAGRGSEHFWRPWAGGCC